MNPRYRYKSLTIIWIELYIIGPSHDIITCTQALSYLLSLHLELSREKSMAKNLLQVQNIERIDLNLSLSPF